MKLFRGLEAHQRRGLPLLLVVGAIMVSGFVLAGCGGGTETTTSTAVDSTTASTTTTTAVTGISDTTTVSSGTTTSEAETTTTTEALSNAEILQPDGTIKAMGFIDKVWESGGKRYISIDFAQMLSGEEARQAAIEDGFIGPDEYLDNDYYIVNDNPRKREFTVADSAPITTATFGGGMDEPVTWQQFKSFWSESPPEGGQHLRDMPWWIVRDGTEVISVAEQYLP